MFALIVIIKLYSLTGVGLVCMRARVARREFCLLRKRGSEMSLLDIGPVIFGAKEGLIDYLRRHHLLADHLNCSRCGIGMRERPRSDVSDGVSWWCPQCKSRKTVRDNSFFKKSHLSLQNWLLLMHYWARNYPVTDSAEEMKVDAGTAVDVFNGFGRSAPQNFCRHL